MADRNNLNNRLKIASRLQNITAYGMSLSTGFFIHFCFCFFGPMLFDLSSMPWKKPTESLADEKKVQKITDYWCLLFCELNTAGGIIISILSTDIFCGGIFYPLVKFKIQMRLRNGKDYRRNTRMIKRLGNNFFDKRCKSNRLISEKIHLITNLTVNKKPH